MIWLSSKKCGMVVAAFALSGCAQLNNPATQLAFQNAAADLRAVESVAAPIACAVAGLGGRKTVRYAISNTACLVAGGTVQ